MPAGEGGMNLFKKRTALWTAVRLWEERKNHRPAAEKAQNPIQDAVAFAHRWAKKRLPRQHWRGERNGHPPGAEEVQDLVQSAFEYALLRREEWVIDGATNLLELKRILRNRICSRIEGLANRKENQDKSLDALSETNPNAIEFSTEADISTKCGLSPGPLLAAERNYYSKELTNQARAALRADKPALKVLDIMLEGEVKPRNIASEMDIGTRDVENIKKRINRKLPGHFPDILRTKLGESDEE
jgi:DNA-directed RNA polymerase specialized sigma24 family protein